MGVAKSVQFGDLAFTKKGDALAFLRTMLNKYSPGDRVTDEDALILAKALQRHPQAIEKIGSGIAHFHVRSAEYRTKCFWVTRTDETTEKFSYKSCV